MLHNLRWIKRGNEMVLQYLEEDRYWQDVPFYSDEYTVGINSVTILQNKEKKDV
jgi:hypothetical protein